MACLHIPTINQLSKDEKMYAKNGFQTCEKK